jgi:PAS domain S-box-containing protein
MSIVRDVTDRIRASEALRESEELYRTLVEISPDSIVLRDMSGKLVWANQQTAELFGCKEPEELIGREGGEFLLSEDRKRSEERIGNVLKSGQQGPVEYTIPRADGTSFIVESRSALVVDSQSRPKLVMAVSRDITERKRAENELRESEERFRSLFEGSLHPITIYDRDANIIMLNKVGADNLKRPLEEIIGKPLGEFVPETHELTVERVRRVLATGEPLHVEDEISVPDGKRWFLSTLHPISDPKGSGDLVQVISYDITDRKRAEDALRESEERYSEILEKSPIPTAVGGFDGSIISFNAALEKLIGYRQGEIKDTGDWAQKLYPDEEYRRLAEENISQALKGIEQDSTDFTITRKDGSKREVSFNTSFLPKELIVQMVDITERKKAEEELRESEEKFRSFVENFNGIAFRGQIYEKPLFIKGAVEEMTGYTEEEIINGDPGWDQLVIEEDLPKLVKDIDKIASIPDYTLEREYRIVRRDGQVRWIQDRVKNSCGADGVPTYVAGTLIDITDIKSAEEARRKAERELEEQRALAIASDRLRSLGEMAAGIAHELNQPLVGVRGMAEHAVLAIERNWELSKEDMDEKLRRIIEQADRMAYIIEHVRMFAREADRPETRPVNVNDVVESSLGLVSAQLRQRGLELECDLAENLPEVEANPFTLEEVVLNLVTNARDAVEERVESDSEADPVVALRTKVDRRGSETWVQVEVADRGVGITAEQLGRVFDPFYTTKDPDKGTGLGLAISKSIIEKLGGTIEIKSEPGGGTTAIISLPAIPPR